MTNNETLILDMTDQKTRQKVILLAAISALSIEVKTGMKMSRGRQPIAIARELGFTGRKKVDGLKYLIAELQVIDPDYSPRRTTLEALDTAK